MVALGKIFRFTAKQRQWFSLSTAALPGTSLVLRAAFQCSLAAAFEISQQETRNTERALNAHSSSVGIRQVARQQWPCSSYASAAPMLLFRRRSRMILWRRFRRSLRPQRITAAACRLPLDSDSARHRWHHPSRHSRCTWAGVRGGCPTLFCHRLAARGTAFCRLCR